MQANKGMRSKKEARKRYQNFLFNLRKKGLFFSRLCEQVGERRQDAEKAFKGELNGERGMEIVKKITEVSNTKF